jgi:hypothetical protein
MGRATARHDSSTAERVSPSTFWSPKRPCNRLCAFSVITVAPSTKTPMEMVIPESDMMLEGRSNRRISPNTASTERTIGATMASELRRWWSTSSTAIVVASSSSTSVRRRVSVAPRMSCVRS